MNFQPVLFGQSKAFRALEEMRSRLLPILHHLRKAPIRKRFRELCAGGFSNCRHFDNYPEKPRRTRASCIILARTSICESIAFVCVI